MCRAIVVTVVTAHLQQSHVWCSVYPINDHQAMPLVVLTHILCAYKLRGECGQEREKDLIYRCSTFSLEAGRSNPNPNVISKCVTARNNPRGKGQQINTQTSNSLKLEINIVYIV